jgi:lipopolysaccharide/colanic/teichoic acid biosynthesis glycosyltransferase
MVVGAEKIGGYSTALNDPRLTSIGKLLRKYKLDELPQFLNVLSGSMSIVGPRPQVFYYVNKYTKYESRTILSVRPGITDIASLYYSNLDNILGSDNVDDRYESEIEPNKNLLRIKYVLNASFSLDLKIILATFFKCTGFHSIASYLIK